MRALDDSSAAGAAAPGGSAAAPFAPGGGAAAAPFAPEGLEGVVNAVADLITVQSADGRVVFANLAAARSAGLEHPEQLLGRSPAVVGRYEIFDDAGERIGLDDLPGRVALRTAQAQSRILRYRARDGGSERWSRVAAVPLPGVDGAPAFAVNIVHDLTELKGVEEALRASEARSRLLADATRDLDESLDLDVMVVAAMRVAVPALAEWATLDLLRPDGTFDRVAVTVADPAMAERAEALRAYPIEPGKGRAGDRALTERKPIIATLSDLPLAPDPARPALVEVIRSLGTTSAMAVPLIARGAVEGVLLLGAADAGRRYDEADAAYAMDLGRRIALAVGNARLYRAEQAARRDAEAAVVRADRLQSLTAALALARSARGVAG
ncbi:MAG: PAS domain-containing protein, partial [Candidatus Limnocylindrales bacterium]